VEIRVQFLVLLPRYCWNVSSWFWNSRSF